MIDFILHIDKYLTELVNQYGIYVYLILFLIVFCETGLIVTPFLPGDSLLFVAGALTAMSENQLNVHFLFLLLAIAAILGDAVNYAVGRFLGENSLLILTQEYLNAPTLIKQTRSTPNTVGKRLFLLVLFR